MQLDNREKKVLELVIEHYLSQGEAVGSRTLVKKYDFEYSPSTVRNIMSDLEDKEYIEKSHTSSGRLPTIKGYKLYISSLMSLKKLNDLELTKIKDQYVGVRSDELISKSSTILSNMTNQASFILEPDILQEKLKKIELVYINEKSFLAVIVTTNSVKTKRIVLSEKIEEEDLKNLSKYANNIFKDQILKDIQISSKSLPVDNNNAILQSLISQIESKVHLSGSESIISHLVETNSFDIDRCKMLQAKEEMKIFLEKLVDKGLDGKKINIVLGDDLDSEKLKGLSFIFSTYSRGEAKGMLGIVGPRRMEYGKVASFVSKIRDAIDKRGEDE